LVEALFEKLKGLENKTGAKIMSFTITYEENLITRENFQDIFEQLLGVRKSSFVSRFGTDKSLEYLTKKRTEQEVNLLTPLVNNSFPGITSGFGDQNQGTPVQLPMTSNNIAHEPNSGFSNQNIVSYVDTSSLIMTPQTIVSSTFHTIARTSGPICSKCVQTVPAVCRSEAEWKWLRCFNPLCNYMVHSTCLGFFANFGSTDLRQFTFPPFYCDQHRLT
jgi:hypothetical protein